MKDTKKDMNIKDVFQVQKTVTYTAPGGEKKSTTIDETICKSDEEAKGYIKMSRMCDACDTSYGAHIESEDPSDHAPLSAEYQIRARRAQIIQKGDSKIYKVVK